MTNRAAKPTAEDFTLAKQVREWMESLSERSDLNDFLYNLSVYGKSDFLPISGIGIAAAAVSAYKREVEQVELARRQRESFPESKHVGVKGDKVGSLNVRVLAVRDIATDFGTSILYKFIVLEGELRGAVLSWFCSGARLPNVDIRSEIWIVGTVKKLGEFNGVAETQLSRVSKVVDPVTAEAIRVAAKAEKAAAAKAKRASKKAAASA